MKFADYIETYKDNERAIQHQLALANPVVELTPVTVPDVSYLTGDAAGSGWTQTIRMYFESRGARIVADKVVITCTLADPVFIGINTDNVLPGTNGGHGLPFYGGGNITPIDGLALWEFAGPISFLSIMGAANAGGNIGINPTKPIPASDNGLIVIRAWGTPGDSFHPRGSR